MNAMTLAPPADSRPAAAAQTSGAVRVRERVIEKVVRETAAMRIGVPRGEVNTEVAEWGGGIAVRIAAKLPIPDLEDAESIGTVAPVLEQVRRIQVALAEELAHLTGREIRRVSFTVTGAIIPERKRVR